MDSKPKSPQSGISGALHEKEPRAPSVKVILLWVCCKGESGSNLLRPPTDQPCEGPVSVKADGGCTIVIDFETRRTWTPAGLEEKTVGFVA